MIKWKAFGLMVIAIGTQVQILYEAGGISHSANTLGKGRHPSILPLRNWPCATSCLHRVVSKYIKDVEAKLGIF